MLKNSASGSFLAAPLTPLLHKLRKYEANHYRHDSYLLNDVALIACFISSEKWVQRDKYPDNTSLPWQKTGVPNNTTMVQTNTILCQFHHNCVVQIHVGSLFLLVHVRFLQSALVFWVKGNIYMTQHHGAFSKRWSSTTANAATYSSLTKTQQVVGPRWKGVGPTKADQDLSFCVAITPH